ncbi:MAG: RDD family protein [Pseudobdellovibrionaceae bacterium]
MEIEKIKPESPDSLKKLFRNRQNLEWEMGTNFHGGPVGKKKGYRLTLWSWAASTIDALLLVAMNCIFLMVFIKIIKIPLTKDLLQDFAFIYVGGAWLYMITTRFFIGSSIGEAACDIRLGEPQERLSAWYFLRVVLRASLIVGTGMIVLPLLSLVFGRDIAGNICGLKLISLS